MASAGHKAFVEQTGALYQAFEVVQAFEIARQHHSLAYRCAQTLHCGARGDQVTQLAIVTICGDVGE